MGLSEQCLNRPAPSCAGCAGFVVSSRDSVVTHRSDKSRTPNESLRRVWFGLLESPRKAEVQTAPLHFSALTLVFDLTIRLGLSFNQLCL